MDHRPYFSILIPVFNQTGKMDDCIRSVKNQTFTDFEVIFVDDGSTDGSGDMLSDFAKDDDRFRVCTHEKNSSLLAARYTGMQNATGEKIVFLDSDDYLSENALERIHDAFAGQGADIVRFGFVREPSGKEYPPYKTDDPLSAVVEGIIPPAIWKNAYSKEVVKGVLERTNSFYCNMGEDSYLGSILLSNAGSFTAIDDILYHYIDGGMSNSNASLSMEKLHKVLADVRRSGNGIIEYMSRYCPERKNEAVIMSRRMIRFVLYQYVMGAADDDTARAFIDEFDNEEDADIYRFGNDVLLPARKLIKEGREVHFDFKMEKMIEG